MQTNLFDLTSSAEDFPAKTCRWLESVLDLLASEAACSTNSCAWSPSLLPAGLLSKTSLAFCRATADGTWEPSSGRWENSGMAEWIGRRLFVLRI